MTIIRNCLICGTEFKTFPSTNQKYCSWGCVKQTYIRTRRTCQFCGKKFEVIPSYVKRGCAKFCSLVCKYKGQKKDKVK